MCRECMIISLNSKRECKIKCKELYGICNCFVFKKDVSKDFIKCKKCDLSIKEYYFHDNLVLCKTCENSGSYSS